MVPFCPEPFIQVGILISSGITPMGGGSLEVPGAKDPVNPTFKSVTGDNK
jgi:hypothetical protein